MSTSNKKWLELLSQHLKSLEETKLASKPHTFKRITELDLVFVDKSILEKLLEFLKDKPRLNQRTWKQIKSAELSLTTALSECTYEDRVRVEESSLKGLIKLLPRPKNT